MPTKRYRAHHITPGLVDYTEGDQRETVLLRKPVLDKMNPSFLGKPVFNITHKNIDPEKAFDFTSNEKDELADGIISNVGYDVETGYYFVDMMIWDEETQKNIDEDGYLVSNAYIPEVGPGGVYNNVPYDEEVIGGEYYHMAIVENPRYGDVTIFQNSNGSKPMKIKIFGKKEEKPKQNAADPPKEEEKKEKTDDKEMAINAESVLVDEQGNEYPLSELVSAYKESQSAEEEKPIINMEDTIEIDGKEVPVKELYDNYCSKKNAEPPTDTPLEDVVKQNSSDVKEKPNDHFKKLKFNAAKGAEPEKIVINTEKKRLERGKQLYGSQPVQAKAQGGKQ